MAANSTPRRWWRRKQDAPGSVAGPDGSDEIRAEAGGKEEPEAGGNMTPGGNEAPPQTLSDLTTDELEQLVSSTVERTLEELLPKQLARQRTMLEDQLRWFIGDLLKNGVDPRAMENSADSPTYLSADNDPEEEKPKINEDIDWGFLE